MEKTERTLEALRYLGFDSVADELAEDDSAEARSIIRGRVEQLGREGWDGTHDAVRLIEGEDVSTIPAAYVSKAMEGRIVDVRALLAIVDGDADQADQATVEGLDIGAEYDDHELQDERGLVDAAEERLDEYPLAVEKSVVWEIVFGTGGPDDRLVIECDVYESLRPARAIPGPGEQSAPIQSYEIRRVLFRYSWSGSAEVELYGDDRETAEAYARRMVPELAE